jgi:inhibitor of KinA
MYDHPRFLPAGDRALVVELGDAIDPAVNQRIRGLSVALERRAIEGVLETVPTYRSLLVHYDPARVTPDALRRAITGVERQLGEIELPAPRVIEVPTVYGGEFGPDLGDVAAHTGLTEDEVIAIHAGSDYLVYMMGFITGFPYLGGMSARIATPRLATPRTVVPAGSVGIAQQQTGIYPVASPGGWRLIGRTPLRWFDPSHHPPVPVEMGDYIRFVPIALADYEAMRRQAEAGIGVPVVRLRGRA